MFTKGHTMKIVNLTPHPINLENRHGGFDTIAPSGELARVKTTTVSAGADTYTESLRQDGYEVTTTSYGEVEGLPASQADTVFAYC